MADNRNETLVLAALLHDIGKFAQRAGRPKSSGLEGEYCPIDKQTHRPTHQHVLYTDAFIEKDLPLPPEVDRPALARLAATHHKPGQDNLEELALQRAECLSAGMDRIPPEGESGDFLSARLVSTFSQVSFQPGKDTKKGYYPLRPIDVDPFPGDEQAARQTDYPTLFKEFQQGLRTLPLDMGVRHYTAALASLLETCTWCIPSSTYGNEPDISLYDHALTTAAIAQALAAHHRAAGTLPGAKGSGGEKFVLVGGDLSGIQKYIFGLEKSHGAGVAKILRARSFQLQALTRSVTLALLDELGLSPVARVMDAGGRFVLLLPCTRAVLEQLPGFEARVQEWFFARFSGRLALNLVYAQRLTEQDFGQEQFRDVLEGLWDRLEVRKMRKFDRVLASGAPPVRLAGEYGSTACAVCGLNPTSAAASDRYARAYERTLDICAACAEQIMDIGRKLPRPENRFLVLTRRDGLELFGGIRMRFAGTVDHHDRDALEILNFRDRKAHAHLALAGYLPLFTAQDVERWEREERKSKDDEPVQAGEPKTFGHLAVEARVADADGLRGKAFLAAFKADVDNLGLVFGLGLHDKLSISRFAGLSRLLNLFFSEALVDCIKREFPDIYVVFAGGDDVFLLGPWTDVVLFAQSLEQMFRRFVGENPDLSLSAGIAVAKPMLPARSVAQAAEDLLDQSKRYARNAKAGGRTKNAFTLFGVTGGWEAYPKLLEAGRWIEGLVLEHKMTIGLAMRLLGYADDCRALCAGEPVSVRKGLYLAHMAYDFKRNLNEEKLTAADKEKLHGLRTSPETLERMRMPLSCALYRIRSE